MSPQGGGAPGGALAGFIERDFDSVGGSIKRFSAAASGEFCSGWAWLVHRPDGRLDAINSSDAENPLQRCLKPLLAIDVWEHAYCLDYQNERGRYIEAFVRELINRDFAAANLDGVPFEYARKAV